MVLELSSSNVTTSRDCVMWDTGLCLVYMSSESWNEGALALGVSIDQTWSPVSICQSKRKAQGRSIQHGHTGKNRYRGTVIRDLSSGADGTAEIL